MSSGRCDFYRFVADADGNPMPARCADQAVRKVGGYRFCEPHAKIVEGGDGQTDPRESSREKQPAGKSDLEAS